MNLLNEFGAQTCLIGEEDLDLTDLDFSMFETFAFESSVYTPDQTNISNFSTQQSAIVSRENPIEKLSNVLATGCLPFQQQPSFSANQLDFDLVDFNLISTGPTKIGSPVEPILDLLNSPSAEITYGNINSIEPSTEDDFSMLSSPASSMSDETTATSVENKPKIRKTRGRMIDKKESNKMAAIRYRTKKLKEKDQLFTECDEYALKIKEMRQKVADAQSEISFIKSLLVEALVLKTGLMK